MSLFKGTEEYYQKFIELQDKLRKSEEDRLILEMKFNEMMQITKEEEQAYYKKLKHQYKQFLENDRLRLERNEKILRIIERIETRAGMLAAKTDRFNLLRKQYLIYLQRIYNIKDDNRLTEPLETPQLPVSTLPPLESKMDILEKYLSSIPSQKTKDEILENIRNKNNTTNLYDKDDKNVENTLKTANNYTFGKPEEYYSGSFENSNYPSYQNNLDVAINDRRKNKSPEKEEYFNGNEGNFTPEEKTLIKDEVDRGVKEKHNVRFDGEENLKMTEEKGELESQENEKESLTEMPEQTYSNNESDIQVLNKQPVDENMLQNDKLGEMTTEIIKDEVDSFKNKSNLDNNEENAKEIYTGEYIKDPITTNENILIKEDLKNEIDEVDNRPQLSENTIEQKQEMKEQKIISETTSVKPENEVNANEKAEEQNFDPILKESYDQNAAQNDYYSNQNYYDENGQSYQYDENVQPVAYQYDENGQAIQEYEQNIQYDENGQPIQGYDTNLQYDQSGQPIPSYDPNTQYDDNGQPLQEYNSNLQYDENGQIIQAYDPNLQFDESGQPIQGYDPNVQYDEAGHPIKGYDPNLQYDESGQEITGYDPNNIQYDENGQIIQPYDQNVQYDENGQLIEGYVNIEYDENGQPIQGYDPNMQYDENGQPIDNSQYETSEQYSTSITGPQVNLENKHLAQNVSPKREDVQKTNVIDMLDTDTESTKQDTKVSNESDFDFSNN